MSSVIAMSDAGCQVTRPASSTTADGGGVGFSRTSRIRTPRAHRSNATIAMTAITATAQRIIRRPQIPSRWIGQVMQCPPPRPLPSSKPAISTTSTPAWRIFEIVNVFRS